jgi:hypothetical protein
MDQLALLGLYRVWMAKPEYISSARALNICGFYDDKAFQVMINLTEMSAAVAARERSPIQSVKVRKGTFMAF